MSLFRLSFTSMDIFEYDIEKLSCNFIIKEEETTTKPVFHGVNDTDHHEKFLDDKYATFSNMSKVFSGFHLYPVSFLIDDVIDQFFNILTIKESENEACGDKLLTDYLPIILFHPCTPEMYNEFYNDCLKPSLERYPNDLKIMQFSIAALLMRSQETCPKFATEHIQMIDMEIGKLLLDALLKNQSEARIRFLLSMAIPSVEFEPLDKIDLKVFRLSVDPINIAKHMEYFTDEQILFAHYLMTQCYKIISTIGKENFDFVTHIACSIVYFLNFDFNKSFFARACAVCKRWPSDDNIITQMFRNMKLPPGLAVLEYMITNCVTKSYYEMVNSYGPIIYATIQDKKDYLNHFTNEIVGTFNPRIEEVMSRIVVSSNNENFTSLAQYMGNLLNRLLNELEDGLNYDVNLNWTDITFKKINKIMKNVKIGSNYGMYEAVVNLVEKSFQYLTERRIFVTLLTYWSSRQLYNSIVKFVYFLTHVPVKPNTSDIQFRTHNILLDLLDRIKERSFHFLRQHLLFPYDPKFYLSNFLLMSSQYPDFGLAFRLYLDVFIRYEDEKVFAVVCEFIHLFKATQDDMNNYLSYFSVLFTENLIHSFVYHMMFLAYFLKDNTKEQQELFLAAPYLTQYLENINFLLQNEQSMFVPSIIFYRIITDVFSPKKQAETFISNKENINKIFNEIPFEKYVNEVENLNLKTQESLVQLLRNLIDFNQDVIPKIKWDKLGLIQTLVIQQFVAKMNLENRIQLGEAARPDLLSLEDILENYSDIRCYFKSTVGSFSEPIFHL